MKKTNTILFVIFSFAFVYTFGCSNLNKKNDGKSITNTEKEQITLIKDKDGNEYKTISIGSQIWMAENLTVEHYRNGDLIPRVEDKIEWEKLTTGAWCYYQNDSLNGKSYGKLYNWYAVQDPRGLAPDGWHIPNDSDLIKLSSSFDGNKTAVMSFSPKDIALGGNRFYYGSFMYKGEIGCFWSVSPYKDNDVWYGRLEKYYSGLHLAFTDKRNGLSCRCVKD